MRKINKPISLSETDSDLFVNMRLFLFDEAFITEFKITNNFPNTVLENLRIELKHSGEIFDVAHIIAAKSIKSGNTGESFVGLKKNEECEDLFPEEKFTAIARFTVKEMNGEQVKATYQDEFSL